MFKQIFRRGSYTGNGPAFADTVVERRAEPRPLRPEDQGDDDDGSVLDDNLDFLAIRAEFPHIAKNLRVYWGNLECVSYLRNLLHDTRGNSRKGFPMDILLALQGLLDAHATGYPHIVPKDKLWETVHRR